MASIVDSDMKPPYKKLTEAQQKSIEDEVCMMLHASRDCLRNQGRDALSIRFDCTDGYFGEAFGIMRALKVLGYGDYHGPVNIPNKEHAVWNLKWWFSALEERVLTEENYHGDHTCQHCYERYGHDDARSR